jgi:imidazolonepropionase-like amidohydrolase
MGPGMERFHFDMRDAFEKQSEIGPHMVISSQILDGPKPIWPQSVALSTAEQGRQAVIEAKQSGVDFIKVYERLPGAVYLAIADESKKQGIPFAGHVPREVPIAEASDAGQKSMEHLGGLALGCSSRAAELMARRNALPGTASAERRTIDAEIRASYDPVKARALMAKLAANQSWQCPTFTVLHAMANLDDPKLASDPRLAYLPAFMRQRWDPHQDFRTRGRAPEDYASSREDLRQQLTLVGELARAGVPLLAGTDEINAYCFAGFSLHDELGWFVKAGLTPLQALRAATSEPARFLGRADLGAIAAGKLADLVALDADPLADIANTKKIHAVVLRGTAHDRAALDRMLAEVKAAAQ